MSFVTRRRDAVLGYDRSVIDRDGIARFDDEGHALVRDLVPRDDVARMRPVVQRVVEETKSRDDRQGRIDDYSALFDQVTNIWRISEDARAIVFDRRFARAAATLLGVDSVRIYHDQALFKPAGGARTPWHQDRYYWPLDTDRTVTMWLPLVDVSEEMGPMMFASRSHRATQLGDLAISATTDERLARVIEERRWPIASTPVKTGEATFHLGGTVHAAGANRSRVTREVLTVIYYDASARVAEPANENQRVDLEVFLPGVRPGEAAASELNPVVYP